MPSSAGRTGWQRSPRTSSALRVDGDHAIAAALQQRGDPVRVAQRGGEQPTTAHVRYCGQHVADVVVRSSNKARRRCALRGANASQSLLK